MSAALGAPSSWRFDAVPRGPDVSLGALLLRASPARLLAASTFESSFTERQPGGAASGQPTAGGEQPHQQQPRHELPAGADPSMLVALEGRVVVVRSCDDAVVERSSTASIGALWACDFDVFC
jgi:hypothetical protein